MKLQVARIGKPHGIRGEVTVEVLTDAPEERFVAGTEYVVDPASAGPLTLRTARWNKGILLLGFEEVADRNHAERLRGVKLIVETGDFEEDDDDEGWYEHELVGLEVRVGGKVVGKVVALNTMPAQDLLIVESADGREILVPFVEAIVPEVNTEKGYVLLEPPAGLFELNTEEAGSDEGAPVSEEGAPASEEGAGADPGESGR